MLCYVHRTYHKRLKIIHSGKDTSNRTLAGDMPSRKYALVENMLWVHLIGWLQQIMQDNFHELSLNLPAQAQLISDLTG